MHSFKVMPFLGSPDPGTSKAEIGLAILAQQGATLNGNAFSKIPPGAISIQLLVPRAASPLCLPQLWSLISILHPKFHLIVCSYSMKQVEWACHKEAGSHGRATAGPSTGELARVVSQFCPGGVTILPKLAWHQEMQETMGCTRELERNSGPQVLWAIPLRCWEWEGGRTHWNCKKRFWLGEEGGEFSSDYINSSGIWSGEEREEWKSRK